MRPDAKVRARAYLVKSAPRSIAGQAGDKTAYGVACTFAVDFGLSDADVAELLGEYNATKCEPKWGPRDLERFLRSARKTANSKPGEVGKLLNVDHKDYTGPRSAPNTPSPATASKPTPPATTGAPKADAKPARTARTPFFEVRRAGEGAERRPSRTFRTALFLSSPKENKQEEKKVDGEAPKVSEVSAPSPSSPPRKPSEPSGKPEPREFGDVTTIWANGDVFRAPAGKTETYLGNINDGRKK